MQNQIATANSGLSFLVDNQLALQAAERLSGKIDSGIRFCCENRQRLTVEQGRQRDLVNASRTAHLRTEESFPRSAADAESYTDDNTVCAATEDDDLLEFESDNDEIDVSSFFEDDEAEELVFDTESA